VKIPVKISFIAVFALKVFCLAEGQIVSIFKLLGIHQKKRCIKCGISEVKTSLI